jgi:hypothetical protein
MLRKGKGIKLPGLPTEKNQDYKDILLLSFGFPCKKPHNLINNLVNLILADLILHEKLINVTIPDTDHSR